MLRLVSLEASEQRRKITCRILKIILPVTKRIDPREEGGGERHGAS